MGILAKFTLLGRFDRDRIPTVLPPDYRSLIPAVTLREVVYTVVLFAHDRRDVVTSAPVRRALAEIPIDERVLAVGGNFTAEAIELLNSHDAAVARLGEFYWTDESYHSLH